MAGRQRDQGRAAGRRTERPLAGKRLAAAVHPIAIRLDPARSGVGPRDLLAAAHAEGVPLDGDDHGYMTLYAALNAPTGLFERAERGRYVWVDAGPAVDAR